MLFFSPLPTALTFGMGFVTSTPSLDEVEMGNVRGKSSTTHPRTGLDVPTMLQFSKDYRSAGSNKRPIFEKYLNSLGSDWILSWIGCSTYLRHSQKPRSPLRGLPLWDSRRPSNLYRGSYWEAGWFRWAEGLILRCWKFQSMDHLKFCSNGVRKSCLFVSLFFPIAIGWTFQSRIVWLFSP